MSRIEYYVNSRLCRDANGGVHLSLFHSLRAHTCEHLKSDPDGCWIEWAKRVGWVGARAIRPIMRAVVRSLSIRTLAEKLVG